MGELDTSAERRSNVTGMCLSIISSMQAQLGIVHDRVLELGPAAPVQHEDGKHLAEQAAELSAKLAILEIINEAAGRTDAHGGWVPGYRDI